MKVPALPFMFGRLVRGISCGFKHWLLFVERDLGCIYEGMILLDFVSSKVLDRGGVSQEPQK